MTRLKELGRSGNYVLWNSTWLRLWISSQRGGIFETILSLFTQSKACLELRDRDGDQGEFLSRRLEQYDLTLRVMYQCLTETCHRQEAIRHDVEQLMNALRHLFPLVSVRHWYIMHKVCSYCSNPLDRNSAWSPPRNSKHASLWLNNDKIVSKHSSTLWRNS